MKTVDEVLSAYKNAILKQAEIEVIKSKGGGTILFTAGAYADKSVTKAALLEIALDVVKSQRRKHIKSNEHCICFTEMPSALRKAFLGDGESGEGV